MNRHVPIFVNILLALVVASGSASTLPGFQIERVVSPDGFPTSLVFGKSGEMLYSTAEGSIYVVEGERSRLLATVPTAVEGNEALLGIAPLAANSVVAHYVSRDHTQNILSRIDLSSGSETVIANIPCNQGLPCSSEHHGGNPIVTSDGTIFVGLGDFGAQLLAQDPTAPAGKIVRIAPDGTLSFFARGFRNPFDLALDPVTGKLVLADNGPVAEDEVHIISEGDNAGWPLTMGKGAPLEGAVPPIYTFDETIAPTGLQLLRATTYFAPGSMLLAGFVPMTLHYFPEFREAVVPDPIEIIRGETGPITDVTQDINGEIFFAAADGIFRLVPPLRGDADGNGIVEVGDLDAIQLEIEDDDGRRTIDAQGGTFRGSWGADANRDGMIDQRDVTVIRSLLNPRRRGARRN